MIKVQHLDHVAITVKDLERSVKWYQDVLNLEQRYKDEWEGVPIMMCAGDTCVALFKSSNSNPLPPPGRDTISMMHLAFRTDRKNFENAQVELKRRRIEFEFADHGVSHSIYFHDPDGHEIEITTYEIN
ncbi:MAG: VOC family protein [Ignavibacteria bacterium]